MTDQHETAPPGIDVSIPSVARVYDYMLGGKDNFASDRRAGDAAVDMLPQTPLLARDNRDMVRRSVRWLVGEAGVRQIIDIGSGLPSAGNVHEIAAGLAPDVHVVYADNDPIVLAHGRALLSASDTTAVIQADIREPDAIFDAEATRRLIDFDRPFAVLVAGLLHHLADAEDPVGVIDHIKGWLHPGCYLLVCNFFDPEDDPRAQAVERGWIEGGLGTGRFRTRAEQEPFYRGLELVEPGLVFANEWKPDQHSPRESPVHRLYVGAVGRKL